MNAAKPITESIGGFLQNIGKPAAPEKPAAGGKAKSGAAPAAAEGSNPLGGLMQGLQGLAKLPMMGGQPAADAKPGQKS